MLRRSKITGNISEVAINIRHLQQAGESAWEEQERCLPVEIVLMVQDSDSRALTFREPLAWEEVAGTVLEEEADAAALTQATKERYGEGWSWVGRTE